MFFQSLPFVGGEGGRRGGEELRGVHPRKKKNSIVGDG